jgi:hypothetical protein
MKSQDDVPEYMDEYSGELDDLMRIVHIVLLLTGGLKINHHQVLKTSKYR